MNVGSVVTVGSVLIETGDRENSGAREVTGTVGTFDADPSGLDVTIPSPSVVGISDPSEVSRGLELGAPVTCFVGAGASVPILSTVGDGDFSPILLGILDKLKASGLAVGIVDDAMDEGTAVACIEGNPEGWLLGSELKLFDGMELGSFNGLTDGPADGSGLGISLGISLAVPVG